ncbi:MAG TPA: malto-oligosyltrehalose synthase, partial [Thermopolyspora sp.]
MNSTYRVQLTPEFGFRQVADLVDYLRELGVTRLYLSPILQAESGSRHGYDVTDHTRIRAEFGGLSGLLRLAERAGRAGLELIADLVPNHMTVPVPESGNAALWSVLRDGPGSPYARWFDIDWSDGQVAMPVLDGPGAGALTVDGDVLRYHDHEFPVRPGTGHLPLPELLEAQFYRLVQWREAPGYRRFFDVSSLIGLRVEDPEVFEATHRVTLSLVADGVLGGLRIDHPDGLADPRGYLTRLRDRAPVWTVVEKILVGGERLPADWACAGTTGYDALNMVTRLFVDPDGAEPLIGTFVKHTGMPPDYLPVVREAKKQVIERFFRGEVDRLIDLIGDPGLREALVELLVAMPVYRAYAVPGEPPPQRSAQIIQAAARAAAAYADPRTVAELADLVLSGPDEVVIRFQQTSGPVMAKGVEDTALYRWYPLACLNEVGGEPGEFGVTPAEFHEFCAALPPLTMTTLSTHDTKRSEDVRARLAVLSEIPDAWAEALDEWAARVGFDPLLDYLGWQNLMAAWPIDVTRFTDYLLKAAREAKTSISWMNPDPAYEQGVRDFARHAIAECGPSIAEFTSRIDRYARINSLGQKAVQLLMPGIADVYQGNEITDFSLVDPDNRRPVDFAYRRRLLTTLDGSCPEPAESWDRAKLRVTRAALGLRARLDPAAPYIPIEVDEHAVTFARDDRAIVVAT